MYRYSLRYSLLPTLDFEERIEKLIDFCKTAEIDDVMFFISPKEVNVGHITIEEAKKYVDVISRAVERIKDLGVTVSLNPWVTLGHYDSGLGLKDGQNFQTMVGHDGTENGMQVCPLDENWRKYFVELMNFYVETLHPDVLWLEDDFRMGNHEPIRLGCFCKKHMKLFQERLGEEIDRETLLKRAAVDKKARKAYFDVVRETIEGTMEYIVENVKGQKTFGLMTGGSCFGEARRMKKLFSTLASGNRNKPYNRLSLCAYRQRQTQEYCWLTNGGAMFVRALTGDSAVCVSELEDNPHTYYSKTAQYLKYQLLSSVPQCLQMATFSIFEFLGNGVTNGERYAAALKEVKPYLNKVESLGLKPVDGLGVKVLVNESIPYRAKAKESVLEIGKDGSYLFAYLTQLGIAATFIFDENVKGEVVAVSGQVLRCYDKETVVRLFENNFVVLTAENVMALKDMGLAYLIDMVDYEICKQRFSGKYSFEECATDDKILGVTRLRAPSQFFAGDYCKITYGNAPRTVYTRTMNAYEQVVGEAIVASCNALVIPYVESCGDWDVYYSPTMLHPLRGYSIKKALRENAVKTSELFYTDEENVCPYVFEKEGVTYIVCVNYVEDEYPSLHLRTENVYKEIKIVTPESPDEKKADYTYRDGVYEILAPVKAMSSFVLICKK